MIPYSTLRPIPGSLIWTPFTILLIFLVLDVDECVEGLANCGAGAECINLNGTYECQCLLGYQKSENNCTGRTNISSYILLDTLNITTRYLERSCSTYMFQISLRSCRYRRMWVTRVQQLRHQRSVYKYRWIIYMPLQKRIRRRWNIL